MPTRFDQKSFLRFGSNLQVLACLQAISRYCLMRNKLSTPGTDFPLRGDMPARYRALHILLWVGIHTTYCMAYLPQDGRRQYCITTCTLYTRLSYTVLYNTYAIYGGESQRLSAKLDTSVLDPISN